MSAGQITAAYRLPTALPAQSGKTLAWDAQNCPFMTGTIVMHAISGTGATITVGFETSDDGEVWTAVGATFAATAVGAVRGGLIASATPYGRWGRFSWQASGTGCVANFSLYANLYDAT